MKTILLTGYTGYIGRRLKEKLDQLGDGKIRILVRNIKKVPQSVLDSCEVVEGNTFDKESLIKALEGVYVAYYLIHSMGSGSQYDKLDRISAENFRDACIETGVRRIIYLGGLGTKKTASKHLLSRIQTGEILSDKPHQIQTIWFRAGVIIGSGSASFEIIRNLVQKIPVMVAPRWVNTKTEPIAVEDVLAYLVAAVSVDVKKNLVVDIGSGQLTFREMLLKTAKEMGLTREVIATPFLTPKLSSYWLNLFTPVSFSIASALAEGLKSETVKQNDNSDKYFSQIKPMSFEQAVKTAIWEIENNQVISRWCDSSAGEVCDVKYQDDTSSAVFRDTRTVDFGDILPSEVFKSAISVGGKTGWFTYQFLWELRGWIDKSLGGCGISRGRRNASELRVGDALDCWKVVDIKKNKRLLLVSQMKLPGKAWLEFVIEGHELIQTAYFYPEGLEGRVYWYFFHTLHCLIFQDLAENIIKCAKNKKKC